MRENDADDICKKVGENTVLKKPHITEMVIHRLQRMEEVETCTQGTILLSISYKLNNLKIPSHSHPLTEVLVINLNSNGKPMPRGSR
jgi:hypothetical protein